MYADEDLIPISALQHHLFCPRQCALIHVDHLWAENRLTAEGRLLHERSDTPGRRTRPGSVLTAGWSPPERRASPADPPRPARVRTIRALPLVSHGFGLVGKADQVEVPVDAAGRLVGPPRPIEHKRGRPKHLDHDRVQLAAQALCLEEMFAVPVPEGELFYHAVRRRERVVIDDALRSLVERVIAEIRANIAANIVPPAEKQKKCLSCSLLDLCMPGGTGPGRSPSRYLSRALAASLQDRPEDAQPDL